MSEIKKIKNIEIRSNLRTHLQNELVTRIKKNPSYSLRSFAKALNIDSAVLSRYLSYKRGLSKKSFFKIIKNLRLTPEEVKMFTNELNKNTSSTNEFKVLSTDQFKVISEWYHYAILEMTYLKFFDPNPQWISKRLGININETKIAIERLKRLNLIEVLPNGKWKDCFEFLTNIDNPYSHSVKSLYQKQILEKSIQALENIPIEQRHQSSLTFAIQGKKIGKIKKITKKYRDELIKTLQKGDENDEVYQLSISLFPLTTPYKNQSLDIKEKV